MTDGTPELVRVIEQGTPDIELFWKNFALQNPTADVSHIRKSVENDELDLSVEAEIGWHYKVERNAYGTSEFSIDLEDLESFADDYLEDWGRNSQVFYEKVEDHLWIRNEREYETGDPEISVTSSLYRFTLSMPTPPSNEQEAA
jgi:hypothetical protein